MAYTRDDRLLRYVGNGLTGGIGGERVWLGLGSWLFADEPRRIQAQLDVALSADPPGIVLFSYDALAATPERILELDWTPE